MRHAEIIGGKCDGWLIEIERLGQPVNQLVETYNNIAFLGDFYKLTGRVTRNGHYELIKMRSIGSLSVEWH